MSFSVRSIIVTLGFIEINVFDVIQEYRTKKRYQLRCVLNSAEVSVFHSQFNGIMEGREKKWRRTDGERWRSYQIPLTDTCVCVCVCVCV